MSRKTMSNIKQNLFWALGYNTLGIPIARSAYWRLGLQERNGTELRIRCSQRSPTAT